MGYIYIAQNEFVKSFIKIGVTERKPQERVEEVGNMYGLSKTFNLVSSYEVQNPMYLESIVCKKLEKLRVGSPRELFICTPEYIEDVILNSIDDSNTLASSKKIELSTTFKSLEDFSKFVKYERKRQNITQEQLSGVCGLGRRFISDLESGKETIQMGKAIHLAKSLGIELFAKSP